MNLAFKSKRILQVLPTTYYEQEKIRKIFSKLPQSHRWVCKTNSNASPVDSKVDYLYEQSSNQIDNSIVWLGGKGWTSGRGLQHFERN